MVMSVPTHLLERLPRASLTGFTLGRVRRRCSDAPRSRGAMSASGDWLRFQLLILRFVWRHRLIRAKRSGVDRWISRWASIIKDDYSTGTQRSSRQNNHLYWAAWSVMLAGIVLNDTDLYEWALDRYRFAMKQIQPD